ncbi:Transcriptional regulator, MarR family [Denitratisoma oestradiolicum]|uniref:Transcriptional regulator, MarR family n=2 Tax=Denitratisoma oestradiolicum TaxID=311182 RepID=A0A6S6XV06_9PROT|nr:MarR family transcriptional regulator [Denitratisoma oestradiolicum]CAB1367993.1 Transcriptional regulator, MarR family [Denitratisoma oestradiolicum]
MTRNPDTQLPMDVLRKFRMIFGSVRQHFREVEQSCGVSGSQLWILQEVASMPGLGVSELAARLAIHQSTCSQLVEKLVARGLLLKRRSAQDQRRVDLSLSAEAEGILGRAAGPAAGLLPVALMALSADTLAVLNDSLARVIEHLPSRDERWADRPLADL